VNERYGKVGRWTVWLVTLYDVTYHRTQFQLSLYRKPQILFLIFAMFFHDLIKVACITQGCRGYKQTLPLRKLFHKQIFRTRSDRPWGPPSLLYNGYRVAFRGVKRPSHGVNLPPLSSAEVKERVELYLYSPSGPLWPVIGRILPFNKVNIIERQSCGWTFWHPGWVVTTEFLYFKLISLGSTQSLTEMSTRNPSWG
jgi:hypothetical protein